MINFSAHMKSKLPGVKTTIFTQIGQMANELGAVNLSQGFPNFEVSPELINLVTKAMKEGHNQYAPMQGLLELRQQLSDSFYRDYGLRYDAEDEITITAGGTQAIYTAISTVIHEGDEAIIIEPAFDIYSPGIVINGGIVRPYRLTGDDYKINWSEFKLLITRNTKLIIINTPHNPTSTILSKEDMLKLQDITNNTDIMVLSDEVYEHIVFGGEKHQSVALFPNLAERSFIVGSFSKTFHVTGWKTGFCMAPKALTKEYRKIHQNVVFAGNRPMQTAIAEYMSSPQNMEISPLYEKKRDYFMELMKDSRFRALPSHGSYFQLYKYDEISDEKEMDFVITLLKEHGVAGIPVSYFYSNGYDNKVLRFCFAKTDETLEKAAEILRKV
ncbi:MAG: methionine aminotransferase [Bacteroidales bacterium]|nr:methionine aminotransferase [Bacteroidales bacterium]